MALSAAQKKASAKYDREHIATLGCRVKREDAEAFKAYCERNGKTTNSALKEFVLSCIGQSQKEESANA